MYKIQISVIDSLWSTDMLTKIANRCGVVLSNPGETTTIHGLDWLLMDVHSQSLQSIFNFGVSMGGDYYAPIYSARREQKTAHEIFKKLSAHADSKN